MSSVEVNGDATGFSEGKLSNDSCTTKVRVKNGSSDNNVNDLHPGSRPQLQVYHPERGTSLSEWRSTKRMDKIEMHRYLKVIISRFQAQSIPSFYK